MVIPSDIVHVRGPLSVVKVLWIVAKAPHAEVFTLG